METIYKRVKGETDYFSDREVEPPKKKLAALEELREDFPAEYEAMLATLTAQAAEGIEIVTDLDTLTAVTSRYDFLAPLARETRSAQVTMAVYLMNEKPKGSAEEHIEAIRKATGESWKNLRDWATEPAPAGKPKDKAKLRVPTAVARALDDEIQKGKDMAAARRLKAEQNKAAKEAAEKG
jgi:hypothetical protein